MSILKKKTDRAQNRPLKAAVTFVFFCMASILLLSGCGISDVDEKFRNTFGESFEVIPPEQLAERTKAYLTEQTKHQFKVTCDTALRMVKDSKGVCAATPEGMEDSQRVDIKVTGNNDALNLTYFMYLNTSPDKLHTHAARFLMREGKLKLKPAREAVTCEDVKAPMIAGSTVQCRIIKQVKGLEDVTAVAIKLKENNSLQGLELSLVRENQDAIKQDTQEQDGLGLSLGNETGQGSPSGSQGTVSGNNTQPVAPPQTAPPSSSAPQDPVGDPGAPMASF